MILLKLLEELLEPQDLQSITSYVKKRGANNARFDFVNIGWTTDKNREKDREKVACFIEAGMTWWLESLFTKLDSPQGDA